MTNQIGRKEMSGPITLSADIIAQCSLEDRQAALKAAWIVAFADGRLYAEKKLLQSIQDELSIDNVAAAAIEKGVRSGKRQRVSWPKSEAGGRLLYHVALKAAAADRKITPAEHRIAVRLGQALGFTRKQVRTELNALAPLATKSEQPERGKRRGAANTDTPQSESLKNLLIALGGEDFVESPVGSFLLTQQSILVVILTNLVPVFGVLFFDWRVFTVVFLYWLENVIVGAFNIGKMIVADVYQRSGMAFFMIPFFTFHYGLFSLVHGVFVFVLFGDVVQGDNPFAGLQNELTLGILVALMSLTVEHAYLLRTTFIRTGRYKTANLVLLLFAPYPRIVILHVSLLASGFLIHAVNLPFLVFIVLIPLKIGVDLATLKFIAKMQKSR